MTLPDPLDRLDAGPIFVVGMARSGTTWVYNVLTAHPKVGGALETWMFTRKDGLAPLFTSSHWRKAGEPAFGLGRLMSRDEFLRDARVLTGRWLGRALSPGDLYLVEKTPHHANTIPFIADVFPEARFIHVLRDGRDVTVSVRAAARSWAPLWGAGFGRSVTTCARTWRETVRRARWAGHRLQDRFLEVKYEDLRSDPTATSARLFDFCQIPLDGATLEAAVRATTLEVRFEGERAFRRSGRVGEWRERFTQRDAALFDLAAGDVLIETGYERSRAWWLNHRRRSRRPPPAT